MNKNNMHRGLRIGVGVGHHHHNHHHLDATNNTSPSLGQSGALRTGPYEGKIAGLYDLEETLGRGHFAVVKLARHVFTGEKVAVKVIDKSKLDEVSKAHLFQEVRCMKLVQHPNVVRLYEVIDTATKLYLILELGDGGDLYDYIMRHDTGLSEQLAKEYFRQIVKAISYCHQLHVVHRDLKPENVVFFEKLGVVKLTDFGFSNKFCPGQKLETSCGSLAYSAPEILLGDSYDAPAVDVWSLGVILYMLVVGQAPFQEANDSETLTMIMDCKYNVPSHISKDCQDLISRMLVKNPEKRATLAEIASHRWLASEDNKQEPVDALPLVSREQLSEEDHNLIVQKIVNGNIATKEEIQECLDKNEYNHITATYYLLAERKLRSKRQQTMPLVPGKHNNKRPEHLPVTPNSPAAIKSRENNNGVVVVPAPSCLLAVPRTPGDIPQRSRKCSIVQEDEEEEDPCPGRDELIPPLNRRGSRSEGRLNLALQERLSDSEQRRKVSVDSAATVKHPTSTMSTVNSTPISVVKTSKSTRPMEKSASVTLEPRTSAQLQQQPIQSTDLSGGVTTTFITDSSTISIPIITMNTAAMTGTSMVPKYKTMPSPTRTIGGGAETATAAAASPSPSQLVEIFEECADGLEQSSSRPQSRQFVSRNATRTSYEQRRSKFHKARTASCSSSDASDDDSEKRKKRAHKLGNAAATSAAAKPFQGRRDSHDDSSDSQEPGTGANTAGNNGLTVASFQSTTNSTSSNADESQHKTRNGNSNNNDTEQNHQNQEPNQPKYPSNTLNAASSNCPPPSASLSKRHKNSTAKRRNRETRLRESQSLNRITEVQEDGGAHAALVIATTLVGTQGAVNPKLSAVRTSIGSKILQGFTLKKPDSQGFTLKKPDSQNCTLKKPDAHISRKDTIIKGTTSNYDSLVSPCDANASATKSTLKKVRLLGKYFHIHKKLCSIPLPFGNSAKSQSRLYKAQSCGSLARDRVVVNDSSNGSTSASSVLCQRQRAASVMRNNSDGDINQNDSLAKVMLLQNKSKAAVVQLNNVCNELTGICAVHLGQTASKCCSFC